jgi:hypothetical protein
MIGVLFFALTDFAIVNLSIPGSIKSKIIKSEFSLAIFLLKMMKKYPI